MAEIIDGKPTMRRFWIPILCGIAVLCALAYAGHRAYAHWEPIHLVSEARKAYQKKDYAVAGIELRRALQINPGCLPAVRFAAEMLEAGGSPEAVKFRAHALDLPRSSVDDKLAWLAAAIQFNQPAEAEKAMATFTEAEKKSAAYDSLAGDLAATLGKYDEAAGDYADALKLDPKDESTQLKRATMQLHSEDSEVRRAGIDALKKLSAEPRFAAQAHRVLIRDLISRGDMKGALAESQPFQGSPAAEFDDRLTHLNLLEQLHKPEATGYLPALQVEAAKTPRNAGLLINWMNGRGKLREAIEWAHTLPKTFAPTVECGAPLADDYLNTRDWTNLERLTTGTNWNAFEFLRLALLARAERENGKERDSEVTWHAALAAAAGNKSTLSELLQLVTSWGPAWDGQLNDVLWAFGEKWDDRKALQLLYEKYIKARDTSRLCEVTQKMVSTDPSDRGAANNFTMFSLLLKRDLPGAEKRAADLYAADPRNPDIASTYAFALYLQGYPGQALSVMNSLDPQKLNTPAIAAYYGIFLAANNKPSKAAEFLRIAQKNANLLPEEKDLMEEALRKSGAAD